MACIENQSRGSQKKFFNISKQHKPCTTTKASLTQWQGQQLAHKGTQKSPQQYNTVNVMNNKKKLAWFLKKDDGTRQATKQENSKSLAQLKATKDVHTLFSF